MTPERVEVHPSLRPAHRLRDLRPVLGAELESGQHLERNIGHLAFALLERLESAHIGRKDVDRDVLADEVAVEGLADLVDLALLVLRRRTHHLDDVLHRGLAAERLPEDGFRRATPEPALH